MKFLNLIFRNLFRNRLRSVLTCLSVAVALFLFGSLRSVLTTLDDAVKVGSEARLISRNAISLVFDLPLSYAQQIAGVPGVKAVTWSNWFGGTYIDERNFFPQFAIDPESYLKMYPELQLPPDQKAAFLAERNSCVVGPKLVKKHGLKIGDNLTLKGTIYPGEWTFVIRGIYTVTDPSFGESTMLFHWNYLYEGSQRRANAGTFSLELSDPAQASSVGAAVDRLFENSGAQTKTETERAFQAGFVGMWGNIGFLLNLIGSAVFFAILLVAGNTMMMSARERTKEVGVMKTLGFTNGHVFGFILSEALAISLLGGALGIFGAKLLFAATHFDAGGALEGFTVKGTTLILGLAISLGLGLLSGLVPAWQASRISVVQALRRVA